MIPYKFVGLLILFFSVVSAKAEKPTPMVGPRVIEMGVPTYPAVARAAYVSGTVHLLVATDGIQISEILESDGPKLLILAMSRYVKTWKFEPHKPLKFEITFNMTVVRKQCSENLDPEVVKLILPSYIEITTSMRPECDPVELKTP